MASRRARRSARGDIEMAPSEVEREDDGEGADHDVAEDSDGELEARRQPVVGDGADGRQDELPRQRGEERARDECGPFAGPPPEVRQGQDEGGEIDDGLRVEEGQAEEAEVGRDDAVGHRRVAGDGPRGQRQQQQPAEADRQERPDSDDAERTCERLEEGRQGRPPTARARSGPAGGAGRAARAPPPMAASAAYSPSAEAAPAPSAAATRKPRRIPTSTMGPAVAPTGIAIAQPASAPATNEVATPRRQAADAPGATRSRIAPRLRRYRLPS